MTWDGRCNESERIWKMIWSNCGVCPYNLKKPRQISATLCFSRDSKHVPSEHTRNSSGFSA